MLPWKPCYDTTCARGCGEGLPPIGRMVAIVMIVLSRSEIIACICLKVREWAGVIFAECLACTHRL
jgi:hypothetical protein